MNKKKMEPTEQAKKIIKQVCDYFHQDYIMVMSKRRFADLVKTRVFSIYFITNEGYTMTQAASFFGMDHSTASTNLRKLEEEVKNNRLKRNQFFELKDMIEALFRKQEEDEIDVEVKNLITDVYGELKPVNNETIEE